MQLANSKKSQQHTCSILTVRKIECKHQVQLAHFEEYTYEGKL